MNTQVGKERAVKEWKQLFQPGSAKELLRILLWVLFPVLTFLLMKRNDLSLEEDLARLSIFTLCTALWYLTLQKRSPHAQLRKPLHLESPPEKL